jgi:proline iminopeptidase
VIRMTRRAALGTAGAVAALPLLVPGCASVVAAPASAHPVPSGRADGVRTGGSQKVAVDGRYEVWVKQIGTGDVPLLTLHGGPGFPHYYLECFEDFMPRDRIRFWYYDQLGCGFSDRPDDPTLWTVDRFREEVEQVRAALGLERFVLYGHSWGGMLGIEYALAYPQHVSKLVISNMTASIPSYVKHVRALRAALPSDVDEVMRSFEDRGDYSAPEYQELLMAHLYAKYLCRLDPLPEPALRSFASVNEQVYNTMQGPSEFTVNGNFASWDRWADLHRISAPTLLLVGRHDTMAVSDIERMGTRIPRSQVVVCENGSHLAMYDDQKNYFSALVSFLLEGTQ